mmetsp:Transcript_9425/g.14430  ORF Transcript_9425/g.14430 Transcript_9425/m.14430 type:complete len:152 (+) Transcript_9425:1351-1806(+)
MKQGSSKDTLQSVRQKEPTKVTSKAPGYLKGTKSTQHAAVLTERMKNAPVSPDRFGTKIIDSKKKKSAISPAPRLRPATTKKPTRGEELKEESLPVSQERGGTAKKKNHQKFLSKNTKKKLNKDIEGGEPAGQERTQIIYHGPAEPSQNAS